MSRIPETGYRESDFPPIVFYLNCVATNVVAQTEGFVFLKLVPSVSTRRRLLHPNHSSSNTPVVIPSSTEVGVNIASSVPVQAKKLVLVTAFAPGEEHLRDYREAQYQRQQQARTESVFQKRSRYIIGQSIRETIRLLEEEGIDRSCIPMKLGGDYFYTKQFDDWIRTRLSMEDCMGAAPPVQNSSIVNAVVRHVNKRTLIETAKRIVTEDQRQHHHHYSDAATVVTDVSSDCSTRTKKSNRGRRPVVCHRLPNESEEDFERRRMHLYGKRSYERKRSKLPNLQEQFQLLDQANRHLRTKNASLEALINQARQIVGAQQHLHGRTDHHQRKQQPHNQEACAGIQKDSSDDEGEDNDDISIGSLSFLELV